MSKFFVSPSNIEGNIIKIDSDDVNHITKVLRLSQNDIIMVCDGNGKDYNVSIEEISKKYLLTRIIEEKLCDTEPPIEVVLFQGIPKTGKMEYIIQKTTELGISKIVPVLTKRTVVRLDDKKSEDNKVERWQKVAMEAAKQSNRGKIPIVSKPVNFAEALALSADMDIVIIPYEKEKSKYLNQVLTQLHKVKKIGVFIGPEGGFEEYEIEMAKKCNIAAVSLGPRILRTETAGAAVLAILMYVYGGM